ncbi:MAG TPA: M1 family metallopeptidase, partial [Anaerolineales bacterium]|nr:M1 family metallopeptidase [Anaerolineales bacterium]
MNKIFVFFVILTLLLVSCVPIPQAETPAPTPDPFDIPWEDRSIFKSGLIESQQSIPEELDSASVYHIDLNIAEDMYHVSGHQEVQYTITENVPLDEVQLRPFPNLLGGEMEVSNLKVSDAGVTPRLEMNDSLLIVPWAAPLEPGDSAVIEMDFDVTIPQEVDLNYGVLAYYEDVLALAHAYPMIAVYNDEGWNAEIPSQQGDITFADTSFFLVNITAPKEVTVVPSGTVVERAEGERTQTLLVASGPARDFYLAASPDYKEYSQTLGEITVRSFAPRDSAEAAKAALEIALDSLDLFSAKYPAYPYTELDIVATPTLAGGIEYPGNIVVTSGLYGSEANNPGARQYLEGVVAHEVAHQWFYNLIGDDQLDNPWLDEALAQYLTYEYFS